MSAMWPFQPCLDGSIASVELCHAWRQHQRGREVWRRLSLVLRAVGRGARSSCDRMETHGIQLGDASTRDCDTVRTRLESGDMVMG